MTDIEIAGLGYEPDGACHSGHVTMELTPKQGGTPTHMHFACRSALPADTPADLIRQDLIEDALRQARRMPGFRRGEREIELPLPRAAPSRA
ncbi:hypothetical protein [Sinisalibacter aestuarii]|uniref:hypothetical protein n=1 Tax=Sinisalibacter aestuarii TaxID=2949426 RepID=UPI00248FC152|nr:hypothetical protein [Sinisalibacter aestuarii]